MASGSWSRSVLGSSDELVDFECGICLRKGIHREAKMFCKQCKGYLCSFCLDKHSRFPAMRNHETISVERTKGICGICKVDDESKNTVYFCNDCDSLICDDCLTSHESFRDLQEHTIVHTTDMIDMFDSDRTTSTDSSTSLNNINVLGFKTIKKIKEVLVKVASDQRYYCHITGSCFMPGGQLVLCDNDNSKIKLLAHSLAVVDKLDLPGGPWDVAAVDSRNAVVTIPGCKQLQYIQVLPSLKLGRTIDFEEKCWGVAVAAGKIVISCYNTNDAMAEIRVYDLKGRDLEKRLGIKPDGSSMFICPDYVAISRSGDKIFVSDRFTKTVSCLTNCLTSAGKIVYQYRDDDMKWPRGLFVDDNDNLIVCGLSSRKVQVITSAGRKHKALLLSEDGIYEPRYVSFRPSDGTLIVCGCSNNILAYQMAW